MGTSSPKPCDEGALRPTTLLESIDISERTVYANLPHLRCEPARTDQGWVQVLMGEPRRTHLILATLRKSALAIGRLLSLPEKRCGEAVRVCRTNRQRCFSSNDARKPRTAGVSARLPFPFARRP